MFKAPSRSKRRLRAEIGSAAEAAATHLCNCAIEDMTAWPGPCCLAPANTEDRDWANSRLDLADIVVDQPSGNLGERIQHVNGALLARGYERQIFIGSDCPTIDVTYLMAANTSLEQHDVVLGPASDGGVVLMGTKGAWPALADLPWSSAALMQALIRTSREQGHSLELLEERCDVDRAADLNALGPALVNDQRPARRAFRQWITTAL